jgi:acyl-CoA thioesterase II
MAFDLANLISCLTLRETGPGRYEGDNLALDYRRVFGGQLLAQTVQALRATAEGKSLKSLTQLFPREGDVALPVTYDVDELQTGRTFASRAVRVTQDGKLISAATASLHVPEPGLERRDPLPTVAGPADAVPMDIGMVPWEIRVVDGIDLNEPSTGPAEFQMWMRIPNLADLTDDDSDWTHQSLLAHSTDLTVIGTALLPVEGLSQADTGTKFHSAVTSHSMWFHESFRLSDWLLVSQVAPVLSGARVFGRGDVWSADGRLVASFAQESMVRMLPTS